MNERNAPNARIATALLAIALATGGLVALAAGAAAEGQRHPFFPTEPSGPGSGLYLTDGGMTTKDPKKGETKTRSYVTDTPLTSANTFTHLVTYKYLVTWEAHEAQSSVSLTGDPVTTLYLSVETGTAQLAIVGAILAEDSPDFLFPDFCSQDYSAAASGEQPTILRSGAFQAFTTTGCELPELAQGTSYSLRIFVSLDALGPEPPVLVLAYGSPAAPSGVWLPGVTDPQHKTSAMRLYVEASDRMSETPPGDSSDDRISCEGCNGIAPVDVPLGSYTFDEGARIKGGAILTLWFEFPEPEDAAYDNGLFLACHYWNQGIQFEVRVNGEPISGRSGHPGANAIDLGEGPKYCLWQLGASIDDTKVRPGDELSLVLVVRSPGVDNVRQPTFFHGSMEKPTSVALQVERNGPPA